MPAKSLFLFITIFALLLAGCGQSPSSQAQTVPGSNQDPWNGTIVISGAFALYPMMTRWAEEFQKIHPGVKFDVSGGGAGKGMTDALAGAVDIGMVSRGIKAEEEKQGAYAVAVTKDAVFPMINAKNP